MPVEPTRPRNDAKVYKAISDSEHRLMEFLDRSVKDIKDLIQERKIETAALEKDLQSHEALSGHPLLLARVEVLEKVVETLVHRPIQSWQVVTVAMFVLFSFMGLIVSVISLIHGFVR